MSRDAVKKRIAAGATIVDERSPAEFRAGAYPGAINIPLQELGRRVAEIESDRPVVLYCASGMRSSSAAAFLKKAGFTDVVNAGGLADMPR
jgi:phage shock protein E